MRVAASVSVFVALGLASAPASARADEVLRRSAIPILFQPNVGQTAGDAPITARFGGGRLDLTPDGFLLTDGVRPLRFRFAGSARDTAPIPLGEIAARANYFLGSDPSRWRRGIPQYEQVRYRQLYPGIDARFHVTADAIEFDFEVAPGGDPSRIALDVRGASRMYVDAAGDLVVCAGARTVRQRRPVAYQDVDGVRRPVDVRYRLAGRRVRLALARYDRGRHLVIDPVLVYSTYVGGASDEAYRDGFVLGAAIDVDAAGAAYTAIGYRGSAPSRDVFIAKFAAGTHALVYSTVLGGTGEEHAFAIAAAPDGSVYVTGETDSFDFPFLNPYQQPGGTAFSAPFLLRLAPDGTLAFATLFSLSGSGRALAAAPDGSVFWSGATRDPAMFTSPGAFQPTLASVELDAFVAHFSAAGVPIAATYLGGLGEDVAYGIALGQDGSIYVGGTTTSTNLPTSAGAFQATPGRRDCVGRVGTTFVCKDGFVAKLSSNETQLLYLTYLRETNTSDFDPVDLVLGIAVNAAGEAYVTGSTASPSFPSTADAFDTTCGTLASPCRVKIGITTYYLSDVFVTKLNADGTALVYSTFLGGVQPSPAILDYVDHAAQEGAAIRVDAGGRATVTGFTTATDFPLASAIQPALLGSSDAFVSRLSADGHFLEFSTYLGGTSTQISVFTFDAEGALAVALGPGGDVWVAGHTPSTDFPATADAFQPANGGQSDAFITAINVSDPKLVVELPLAGSETARIDVRGWAIDRASTSGSGIDAIHLYAFPDPGSGKPPVFLAAASALTIHERRDDIAALYGDPFRDSGFDIDVGTCCLTAGPYLLAAFAHSAVTNTFSAVATRPITIVESHPILTVDAPADGAIIRSPLYVAGWAIDTGATSGTGIDNIHVWGYPNPGSGEPPVFFGGVSQFDPGFYRPRPDVAAVYGSQFANSGYEVMLRPPPGTYLVAVFGHSTLTNDFTVVKALMVTVQANPLMALDSPSPGTVGQPFKLLGWAVDVAAPTGTGVDAIHVWAYPDPGSGTPPVFLGVATYGELRPDVGAALGDARFAASGYELNVSGLAPGIYDFVVFAHSSVTATFSNYRVVRLMVQ